MSVHDLQRNRHVVVDDEDSEFCGQRGQVIWMHDSCGVVGVELESGTVVTLSVYEVEGIKMRERKK